jgi:ATP-dependent RNA helicase SUPV3L1/SUV3
MFNNRIGNIKFLVATDAVGMGLNLNIQRVIFSTVEKTMNRSKQRLEPHTVKQIGGRAGRYTQDGQVTAFAHADLQHIRRCIGANEKSQRDDQKEPGVVVDVDESDEEESQNVADTLQQMIDRTRELKFDESEDEEEDGVLLEIPDIESVNRESGETS